MEDVLQRVPRGFAPDHEDLEWIKLKRFVVVKKISVKDFSSSIFSESVIKDLRQALRLNKLLDQALKLRWPPKTSF